jgi:hypothetical protein
MRDYGLNLGIYGFGNVRTISDYEKYAGVKFKKQLLHIDTIRGIEPSGLNDYKEKGFYLIKTFDLDFELSSSNTRLLSNRTNRISIGLMDFQYNVVCLKKLSQRQIRNAINSNRIQTKMTLKPRARIAWWFIMTRNDCRWNDPVIVKAK